MTPHDELRELQTLLKSSTPWNELDNALNGPRAENALIYLRSCKDSYVAYIEAWKRFAACERAECVIKDKELKVAIREMRLTFDSMDAFLKSLIY